MAHVPQAVHELMRVTHHFFFGVGVGFFFGVGLGGRVGVLFHPSCSNRRLLGGILNEIPHRLTDLHCAVHDRAGERKVAGADGVRDAPVEPFHLVINKLDNILAPLSTLFIRVAFIFQFERFGSDIVPESMFARRCEARGRERGRESCDKHVSSHWQPAGRHVGGNHFLGWFELHLDGSFACSALSEHCVVACESARAHTLRRVLGNGIRLPPRLHPRAICLACIGSPINNNNKSLRYRSHPFTHSFS